MNGTLWTSARVEKLVSLFLLIATIFVAVLAIDSFSKMWSVGTPATNVISVDGMGKATAIPDIATISFTVMGEGKNASQAQDEATKKNNVALGLLKTKNIAEKDIKTTSYTVSPKYNYPQPCYSTGAPCVYSEQTVIGYTVNQTTEVKVRDTGKVGDVLSALGDAGISQLYGPNFTVENPDVVQAQARKEAIDEARAKAKVLARDLGVTLVRVVNFSENGGPYPMYYGKGGAVSMDAAAPRATPEVAVGENEYTSNVYITYEIR